MNIWAVLAFAAAACAATMLGGLCALSLTYRRHLVLGFSAGAVLGVAFFDLLPEALSLGENRFGATGIIAMAAAGFFIYVLFNRLVTHHEAPPGAPNPRRALLGAGSFSVHSMLDGFGIGVAFQASPAAGLVVASAVLAHDFSDGLNTVNVVVKHGGSRRQALRWLTADALAPLLGAGLSLLVTPPKDVLSLMLAALCGFFLYIGAVDLLPDSQRAAQGTRARLWTSAATLAGAGLMYGVIRLVTV